MDFQKKYGKILLPLITPYDENEEIDYGKYAELIEYVITNDLCDSLIVTGTTGEASLLTFDERVKLFETAVKASAGRKPVIAGTGCASTKETIALTNKAYDLGIELALIVCPFYNKPTQEGLYLHYKTIAENTKANIMLYNIPIFVGVNLEAETVGRLAAIPNIVGVKDEAGVNPTQVTDFFLATEKVDPNFVVYNGDDIMLLPTITSSATRSARSSRRSRRVRTRRPRSSLFRCIASARPPVRTAASCRTPCSVRPSRLLRASSSGRPACRSLPQRKPSWTSPSAFSASWASFNTDS